MQYFYVLRAYCCNVLVAPECATIWRDKSGEKITIVYMAKKTNPLTTLHHVPLFITCSKKDLKRIQLMSTEKNFKVGDTITNDGDIALDAYILLKGMVEVRKQNKKIASLGAGNILGELALLDNGPRTATLVCVTDCETLAISRKNFHKLLIEIPTLSVKILHGLASRIRKQNDYTL